MARIKLGKVIGDKGTSIRNRGTWNGTAEYINNEQFIDMVSYNGSLWTCVETNTNSAPASDNAKWTLSAKGLDGGADISTSLVSFTQAGSRVNINTGETLATVFGKVKKWFADLGTAAFQGVSNTLTQTATGYVLDARQGKALNDKITSINSSIDSQSTQVNGLILINKEFSGQMTQTCNYPAKAMQPNAATGQYSKQIDFPVAFASEPFVFTTIRYPAGHEPSWVSNVTTQGFVLHSGSSLSDFYVQWFAIGKWK